MKSLKKICLSALILFFILCIYVFLCAFFDGMPVSDDPVDALIFVLVSIFYVFGICFNYFLIAFFIWGIFMVVKARKKSQNGESSSVEDNDSVMPESDSFYEHDSSFGVLGSKADKKSPFEI